MNTKNLLPESLAYLSQDFHLGFCRLSAYSFGLPIQKLPQLSRVWSQNTDNTTNSIKAACKKCLVMDIYLKNFHELLHHPESMCFGTHENIREQFYRRSLNRARILNQLQYFMFSGSLLPGAIWQELEEKPMYAFGLNTWLSACLFFTHLNTAESL